MIPKEIEDELNSLQEQIINLSNRAASYLSSRYVSEIPPTASSIPVFHPSRKKWDWLAVGTDGQALVADSTQDAGVTYGSVTSAWLHLGI